MPNRTAIRQAAGLSQLTVAARTETSLPTVRLFEKGGPDAIAHARKREALVRFYDALAPECAR